MANTKPTIHNLLDITTRTFHEKYVFELLHPSTHKGIHEAINTLEKYTKVYKNIKDIYSRVNFLKIIIEWSIDDNPNKDSEIKNYNKELIAEIEFYKTFLEILKPYINNK